MATTVAPFAALFLSVALLLMGNGLQGTLLPLRANIEDFAAPEIGLISTAYYIGFSAGCYFGSRIVQRAGHIRAFSAMASLASAIALLHALFLTPVLWWLFRFISGFCFAVLYVVIESWLNERSSNENRGLVLSIYSIINLTVISVGQMMLTLYDPAAFPLFALASVLVSLAVIPVAMTTATPPAPVATVRLRLAYLYRISPVGCAGALIVGMANGGFWAMGPIFAQERGFDVTGIAFFMSAAVLAGALGQWPLGQISDKHDRRSVIAGACAVGTLSGAAMAILGDAWPWMLYVSIGVFGSTALPLYALCVAHVNDFVGRDEFVEASSVMLLMYAFGAAIGAIPASVLMDRIGPEGLFVFTAVAHVALATFTLIRMRRRLPTPTEDKERFVGVPRTSPSLYALDPRSGPSRPDEPTSRGS